MDDLRDDESREVGLRERKRAKTAEAIHVAAVELVLERGFDAATVDAISERADVSPRTFFNYFSSKEDAVLGVDEAAISRELGRERETPDDLLRAVFDLLYALFEASGGAHNRRDLTREAILKSPPLMARQMTRLANLDDALSGIIAAWLADDPRFAADDEAERLEQARIILAITLATVKTSMSRWASAPTKNSEGGAPADPRKAYERSITTLKNVLDKLA